MSMSTNRSKRPAAKSPGRSPSFPAALTGDLTPTFFWLGVALLLGLSCVVLHCFKGAPVPVMWALAFLASGGAVGFLFGIPKILQGDVDFSNASTVEPHARYKQQVNTNLEQISDWLTKIIVGLGLVELGKVPGAVSSLAQVMINCSSGMEKPFAIALIIYFTMLGFLGGYLLTRLFLAGAFSRADRAASESLDRTVDSLASTLAERDERIAATEEPGPGGKTTTEGKPGDAETAPARSPIDLSEDGGPSSLREYFDEYSALLSAKLSNREKLLSASIIVERAILRVTIEHGLCEKSGHSPFALVQQLADKGVIKPDSQFAFEQFWEVRNQVFHGRLTHLTDDQLTRILELGWRLMQGLCIEIGAEGGKKTHPE
jgi:hypothetical protein